VADKQRLDQRLVELNLVESRTLAQRYVQAGQVFVNGQKIDKPATKVVESDLIKVTALPRFVSRGGEKLEAAFQNFDIGVDGKICLDVGASTGGFTDCMLQHGAAKVFSVDVGKHQLHIKLREDARVVVLEELNARELSRNHVPDFVDFATVDVSFISLEKVLPTMIPLLSDNADIVTLIKPQFEAGPKRVGRGGVVKDAEVHQDVLQTVTAFAQLELNLKVLGATHSPIKGPAGNIEFLVHFCNSEKEFTPIDWNALVANAHQILKVAV
jgi:23S rRNA (cytidine1920-2'-O)/16S rRNA (cytidine1409-2'-O)-methyltransferase